MGSNSRLHQRPEAVTQRGGRGQKPQAHALPWSINYVTAETQRNPLSFCRNWSEWNTVERRRAKRTRQRRKRGSNIVFLCSAPCWPSVLCAFSDLLPFKFGFREQFITLAFWRRRSLAVAVFCSLQLGNSILIVPIWYRCILALNITISLWHQQANKWYTTFRTYFVVLNIRNAVSKDVKGQMRISSTTTCCVGLCTTVIYLCSAKALKPIWQLFFGTFVSEILDEV